MVVPVVNTRLIIWRKFSKEGALDRIDMHAAFLHSSAYRVQDTQMDKRYGLSNLQPGQSVRTILRPATIFDTN